MSKVTTAGAPSFQQVLPPISSLGFHSLGPPPVPHATAFRPLELSNSVPQPQLMIPPATSLQSRHYGQPASTLAPSYPQVPPVAQHTSQPSRTLPAQVVANSS
jgi:hypothetical protein